MKKQIKTVIISITLLCTPALVRTIEVNRETKKMQNLFSHKRTHAFDEPGKSLYPQGAVGRIYGYEPCGIGGGPCPLFAPYLAPQPVESFYQPAIPQAARVVHTVLKQQLEALNNSVKSLEDKVEDLETDQTAP